MADLIEAKQAAPDLPLLVGSGATTDNIAQMFEHADGVIVGSAIVRKLERFADESVNAEEVIAEIGDFAAEMLAACKG